MKLQRVKSLLALVSTALLGIFMMLSITAPAQAQVLLQTKTQGGITCNQYDPAVTWPDTFWNCDPSKTPSQAEVIANAANRIPTKFRTYLNSTQIYVFRNAGDYALYFNTAVPAVNKMGARLPGVAVVFSQATQPVKPPSGPAVITTIDLSPYYMKNMVQQLGQVVDEAVSFTTGAANGQTFTAALNYDRDYMNSATWENKGEQKVWPDIYQLYPGQTAFGILGSAYGNSKREVFGYMFAKLVTNLGDTVPILVNGLNEMPNTLGLIKNYVMDAAPTNPAVSFYNSAQDKYMLCVQQDPYNSSTWPSKYWNCAHPYNPTSAENGALSSMRTTIGPQPPKIPVAWRNAYAAANTELWIVRDTDDPRWFFGWTIPGTGATGYNQYGLTVGTAHRSAIYRWVKLDATQISEATAFFPDTTSHELGHVLDTLLIQNGKKPSHFDNFLAAVTADRNYFNGLNCHTLFDSVTTKPVCTDPQYGTTNIQRMVALGIEDVPEEYWARAFAKQLPGNSLALIEQVVANMPNTVNYMHTAFQTGVLN
ncbi:MAG: hypothetical protein U0105_04785 [Candidatus Obscuribacterales bacterium]